MKTIMKMCQSYKWMLTLLLSFNMVTGGHAQQFNADSAILPLDPTVLHGKLANGFTYYIKKNNAPKEKVVIFLVVKAGFFNEESDQVEFAHLTEHMALRRTEKIPSVRDFFHENGTQINAGGRAGTGLDRTFYPVQIPSTDAKIVNNFLMLMREIAGSVLLKSGDMEIEKKLVEDEIRAGLGLNEEKTRRLNGLLLGDPKFHANAADRLKSITNIDHEAVREFYKKWYRPDLQGIVVVGDIQPEEILVQVQRLFNDLKNPETITKIADRHGHLDGRNSLMTLAVDSFIQTTMAVYARSEVNIKKTRTDYRESLTIELFNLLMQERLKNTGLVSNYQVGPVIGLTMENYLFDPISRLKSLNISISVGQPDSLQAIFKKMYREMVRVEQYGFTKNELMQAKNILSQQYREHIPTSYETAFRLMDHFVVGESVPAPGDESGMIISLLNQITNENIKTSLSKWNAKTNRCVSIVGPKEYAAAFPDDVILSGWISAVEAQPVTAYHEKIPSKEKVKVITKQADLMKLGKRHSYKRAVLKEINASKLLLANGATVLLKPSSGYDDSSKGIFFQGFRHGGFSLYDSTDKLNAENAHVAVRLDKNGSNILQDYLAREKIDVKCIINETYDEIRGNCPASSFSIELMLQTVFKMFTDAQPAEEDYLKWKKETLQRFEMNRNDPYEKISAAWDSAMLGGQEKRKRDQVKQASFARSFGIFKQRYADVGEYVFVVAGNFQPDKIVPMIVKYLGALPGGQQHKGNKLVQRLPGKGQGNIILRLNDENKAEINVFYEVPIQSAHHPFLLTLYERMMRTQLARRLWDKEGQGYEMDFTATAASAGIVKFSINVSCHPAKYKQTLEAIFEEIQKVQKEGPTPGLLQDAVAYEKNRIRTGMHTNQFWAKYLAEQLLDGKDLMSIQHWYDQLDQVTASDIQSLTNLYLQEENATNLIVLPKQ